MIDWIDPRPELDWRRLRRVSTAAGVARWLRDPGADEPAARPRQDLEALVGRLREQGDGALREVAAALDPSGLGDGDRVGVPPRLWDVLLRAQGVEAPGPHRLADEALHAGARRGACEEWWGRAGTPGAAWDDRLWAWGAVAETGEPGLAELSPRLAWRGGDRWHAHPALDGTSVRAGEGPGFLLACCLDAIASLCAEHPLTGRDKAVLWGTVMLPLLALGAAEEPGAPELGEALERPADYAQQLPFHLLHPRAQALIALLDQVATWSAADDPHLELWLDELGYERLQDALDGLLAVVMHRKAGQQWDGGFGFKMLRGLLRETLGDDFEANWDEALHSPVEGGDRGDTAVNELAVKLRGAFKTALAFPGRPPYDGGPAARQLCDLAYLRWTDELFLP